MVGRKPSPLMPRRKKKPASKPREEMDEKRDLEETEEIEETEELVEQTDEEMVDDAAPSSPRKQSKKKTKKRKPRMKRGIKPSAPQEQLSAEDKRVLRRRRHRRRVILRIAVLALVCVLGVVLWLNWGALAPDKIWTWFQDLVGGGTGSFPVDLSGTGARRLEQVEGHTVVLTESHLTYLNPTGAEVARYGCTYADALMRAEGKYVLVAEQDGCRLQLSTRNEMVIEWTSEDETKRYPIRAVALNAAGHFAVLTDGPQGYLVQLCVYNEKGELRYTRNSNRNVVDVALSPDGSTVSLTSVEAQDGTLNTRLEAFSLTADDGKPQCSYVAADTLLWRIEYLSGGMVAAVHKQGVILMNTANGQATAYAPAGMRVLGYAVSGDSVALAMRPDGDIAAGKLEVLTSTGTVSCRVDFTGEFRHLSGSDGRFALLTDSYAQIVAVTGSKGKASVPADGQQVVCAADKAVVMGRNQLNVFTVK